GVFHQSYQSLIQDKYDLLMNTDEPKIIFVAGSSGTFGLDQQMLEEASGYKVVNLGVHAGFGPIFYSEISKANINEGDIVLLAYEYNWYPDDGFDMVGTELIMTGIDDDIELYKYIPARKWPSFLGYLFTYATMKNYYQPPTGIYSREAFDEETTQLIMQRDEQMDYESMKDKFELIDLHNAVISDRSIEYLKEYKKYAEDRGAKVYFVAPPLIENAVICSDEDFRLFAKQEEEKIGIPYISDPSDYLYPEELMYDALYHCNSEGEKVRTGMLIDDLKNAGVID
ncbi:MAG: hypothetical protein IJ167_08355, partial [Lachnospiraceae bacterium]|nr:hypothetical protein [Lachnospiraceae bacterium]